MVRDQTDADADNGRTSPARRPKTASRRAGGTRRNRAAAGCAAGYGITTESAAECGPAKIGAGIITRVLPRHSALKGRLSILICCAQRRSSRARQGPALLFGKASAMYLSKSLVSGPLVRSATISSRKRPQMGASQGSETARSSNSWSGIDRIIPQLSSSGFACAPLSSTAIPYSCRDFTFRHYHETFCCTAQQTKYEIYDQVIQLLQESRTRQQ